MTPDNTVFLSLTVKYTLFDVMVAVRVYALYGVSSISSPETIGVEDMVVPSYDLNVGEQTKSPFVFTLFPSQPTT